MEKLRKLIDINSSLLTLSLLSQEHSSNFDHSYSNQSKTIDVLDDKRNKVEFTSVHAKDFHSEKSDCNNMGKIKLTEEQRQCAKDFNSEKSDCDNMGKIKLTEEQRLQLEEQIRMFVQITTQLFLLSFKIPCFDSINISSKQILEEIELIALGGASPFNAINLDKALAIVDYVETNENKFNIQGKPQPDSSVGIPCLAIRKVFFNSKVFMYPELLPKCGLKACVPSQSRAVFSPVEDNLIALGLEKFSSENPTIEQSELIYMFCHIKANFLPCKTKEQLKGRIKNVKTKYPPDNPINYFLKHNKAPDFPRKLQIFDPKNIKAPKDQPLEALPPWAKKLKTLVHPECIPTERVTTEKPAKKPQVVQRVIIPNGPIPCPLAGNNVAHGNSISMKAQQPPKRIKPRLILPKPVPNKIEIAPESPPILNTRNTKNKNYSKCNSNLNDDPYNCNLISIRNNKSVNVDSGTHICIKEENIEGESEVILHKSLSVFSSKEKNIIFKSEIEYETEKSMDGTEDVTNASNLVNNHIESSKFSVNTKDGFYIKSEFTYENEESMDCTEDASDTENLSSQFCVNTKVSGIPKESEVLDKEPVKNVHDSANLITNDVARNFLIDIKTEIDEVKIRSEVIENVETAKSVTARQFSDINCNTLASAHYKPCKGRRIKCKNNDKITNTNCPKVDQKFDKQPLDISIKQEVDDDNNKKIEDTVDATCSNFVSNVSKNKCNNPKKSKVSIKFRQDASGKMIWTSNRPCLNKMNWISNLPCLDKTAKNNTIVNNGLQAAHDKTPKQNRRRKKKALIGLNSRKMSGTKYAQNKQIQTRSRTKGKNNAIVIEDKVSEQNKQKKRKAFKSAKVIHNIRCNSKNSFRTNSTKNTHL